MGHGRPQDQASENEAARRARGLATAQARNTARTDLKRRIREGEVGFLDLIEGNGSEQDEELMKTTTIAAVLDAIPGVAQATIREVCLAHRVFPTDKWGSVALMGRKRISESVEQILEVRGLL